MKILKSIVAFSLVASAVFAAENIETKAIEASNQIFELQREAAKLQSEINKIHDKIFDIRLNSTKNLKPEEIEEFNKNFRYQMRQNMAKLGKDEDLHVGFHHNKKMHKCGCEKMKFNDKKGDCLLKKIKF